MTLFRRLFLLFCVVMVASLTLMFARAQSLPITVMDSQGNVVRLKKPAQRIVTLAPNATELVAAAGGVDKLVAVSLFSDTPEATRLLPKINGASLNIETLIAKSPDLIVATGFSRAGLLRLSHALPNVGIYIADAKTPERIADDIEALGILMGKGKEARQEATRYRARLRAVSQQHRASRVKVLYLLWSDPIYTVGGETLIDRAISLCGGTNVFNDNHTPSPVVSKEAVIERAPEMIIFGADETQFHSWRPQWETWTVIPAVKNHAMVYVNPDFLHRPGPRFIDGVESLCAAIDGEGQK